MDKRLLIVNVYFAPRSFGGATIIAEEMAKRIALNHGWRVLVLTTLYEPYLVPYAMRRYKAKEIDVIGVNVPHNLTYEETYNNTGFSQIAEQVISIFKPTVIHAHCVQGMGCGYFKTVKQLGIPLLVTAHDCWWICERQFMINGYERYCFQDKIDFRQCRYCVDDFSKSEKRVEYLKAAISNIDLMLFPSDFQKELYIKNGFSKHKCFTNKNGVLLPKKNQFFKSAAANGKVRFGFIGGPGPIKGAELIVKAFKEIKADNYELFIVDAAKNVGGSWRDEGYWRIPGNIKFVNPYSMETMDDFFSKIDVLLFPSQWKESFGLTVREALSRDVWVIATEAGGIVEDIHSGINGCTIPMNDYLGLKSALLDCLNRSDWHQYNNTYKSKIRGFDQQAEELSKILIDMVK